MMADKNYTRADDIHWLYKSAKDAVHQGTISEMQMIADMIYDMSMTLAMIYDRMQESAEGGDEG